MKPSLSEALRDLAEYAQERGEMELCKSDLRMLHEAADALEAASGKESNASLWKRWLENDAKELPAPAQPACEHEWNFGLAFMSNPVRYRCNRCGISATLEQINAKPSPRGGGDEGLEEEASQLKEAYYPTSDDCTLTANENMRQDWLRVARAARSLRAQTDGASVVVDREDLSTYVTKADQFDAAVAERDSLAAKLVKLDSDMAGARMRNDDLEAKLAEAERERDALAGNLTVEMRVSESARADAERLQERLRTTCRALVNAAGADGPMDAEDAAARLVARYEAALNDAERLRGERDEAWERAITSIIEESGLSYDCLGCTGSPVNGAPYCPGISECSAPWDVRAEWVLKALRTLPATVSVTRIEEAARAWFNGKTATLADVNELCEHLRKHTATADVEGVAKAMYAARDYYAHGTHTWEALPDSVKEAWQRKARAALAYLGVEIAEKPLTTEEEDEITRGVRHANPLRPAEPRAGGENNSKGTGASTSPGFDSPSAHPVSTSDAPVPASPSPASAAPEREWTEEQMDAAQELAVKFGPGLLTQSYVREACAAIARVSPHFAPRPKVRLPEPIDLTAAKTSTFWATKQQGWNECRAAFAAALRSAGIDIEGEKA